jgi:poly-gamma-glutamate capsule biosynthesis protein CapA/YwtB (metallophosphatase superfamily)
MNGRSKIAVVGDVILNRRIHSLRDRDFLQLRHLVKAADTSIANFEATLPRDPVVPAPGEGLPVLSPEFAVDELRWLGFDVFNLANNHATAFGWRGLADTLQIFGVRGIPVAGGGRTLGEARAPTYHDGATARVAMIGATCTNADSVLAADPGRGLAGRPGANPLRFTKEYALDGDRFVSLADIDRALGTAEAREQRDMFRGRATGLADGVLSFLGQSFIRADEPGVHGRLHEPDICALERTIKEARRQADLVVISIHCHEGARDEWNGTAPPDFLVEAAHRCVEAGADLIAGHGPHRLRGIEIYHGRPIFYSLGNFFLQLETVEPVPSATLEGEGLPLHGVPADYHDNGWLGADGQPIGFAADPIWFETVLAICEFDHGRVTLEIHPIELGQALPRSRRGVPRLVDHDQGTAILGRLAGLSRPFGTELDIIKKGDRAFAAWSADPEPI